MSWIALRRVVTLAAMCGSLGWLSPGVARAQDASSRRTSPSPALPRPAFVPTSQLDLPSLVKIVLDRSPGIQEDLLRLEVAHYEAAQSRLWENPALDATWGTIPLGETNPSDLPRPYARVPNYSVGLSYRFLVGKRGPRSNRAAALERGARAGVEAAARNAALTLSNVLGNVAITSIRIERLRSLLDESRGTLDVARARVDAGSGTPLEVDRLEIELSRVTQQILSAESDLSNALAVCASFVGAHCAAFPSTDEARSFLAAFTSRAALLPTDLRRRPDVRALEATREAAVFEQDLARAQAIPDPTVRVGYTYDTFTISGNQQNSLNVSVSIPLPIVDHGQALKAAAEARESRAGLQRDRLSDAAKARIDSLRQVLEGTRKRQKIIETEMLPRARGVLRDLERAVSGRLLAVTDLIQARRTLGELLLEDNDASGDAFRAALELMGELAFGDVPTGDPP